MPKKSSKHRRDHSLSDASDEELEVRVRVHNNEERSEAASDSDGSKDLKPCAIKMPDVVDREIYKDFPGLPSLQASNITDDDEIWIVQCPNNVDPNLLLQKKINFGGSSKLKLTLEDGNQLKLDVSSENTPQEFLTCILQGSSRLQAVPVPLQGKLVITERIEVNAIEKENFMHLSDKQGKVPQPQGLKVRHPLFGADYLERISGRRSPTKSKKRRKREKELEAETLLQLSESSRKKKRKLEEEEASIEESESPRKKRQKVDSEEVSMEKPESSRKKRQKVDSEEVSMEESETPRRNKRQKVVDSEEVSMEESESSRKKKKKVVEQEAQTPHKSKKAKQHEVVVTPSALPMKQEQVSEDVSETPSSHKKKHRKSKHRDE